MGAVREDNENSQYKPNKIERIRALKNSFVEGYVLLSRAGFQEKTPE